MTRGLNVIAGCIAVAVALQGCGGGGGDGKGGNSSGGGVVLATALVVTALSGPLIDWIKKNDSDSKMAVSEHYFIFGGENEINVSGTLSVVAMRKGDSLDQRNMSFCQAFVSAALGNPAVYAKQQKKKNALLWLLRKNDGNFEDRSDCTHLIGNFDYAESMKTLKYAGRIGAVGPVLVARLGSGLMPHLGQDGGPLLVWDLSRIAPDDFDSAIAAWTVLSSLSADQIKKSMSEVSQPAVAAKIGAFFKSRSYSSEDLQIALIERENGGQ